ncbi:uncharacterized protein Z518_07562 [Rhinocladiella mackenziei CBS 650.93]|uniref:chitinase n=1 Tax=Rhinocladiella mackenziei CBS 650.93 TaxID=1442369 RepID=A0A0D2IDY5_9EURO|nr:uncharacterized protein Z518_07562 [Rhinocladiella mackenziei CBS 650.93]KIX04009.1 hypothetical protein Z518_07562 [Rhinocladiella mackenziei CBS 650.93]
MYFTLAGSVLTALIVSSLLAPVAAQTYSTCNPLLQSGCPADPALGRSVDIDFTSGSSNEFAASGNPTYDSNGAAFTISKSGDSPSISSNWYIMFGHVDFVVKAAPGTGIVSAAILQSDCLDEIDWEWLGGDNTQVQSNYFGKGITTTYNRGAFHSAPDNHDTFHTYSIDWTADQIVWSVDGTTVRAMTQDQAEAGQYPQTPMYVKLGAWAGGDPSNPEGTIQWAGGVTDYSLGPFTMYVKSVHVTDYSTGSQYSYSGTSGTWQSIVSSGGQINSQGNGTPVSTGDAPAVTSQVSGNAPLAFGNDDNTESVYATRTGWPWSGTATATAVTTTTQSPSSSLSASSLASESASSLEVVTSFNDQGFPTLVTIDPAAPPTPKSYDSQGFLITSTISEASSATGAPISPSISASDSGSASTAAFTPTNSIAGQTESINSVAVSTESPINPTSGGYGASSSSTVNNPANSVGAQSTTRLALSSDELLSLNFQHHHHCDPINIKHYSQRDGRPWASKLDNLFRITNIKGFSIHNRFNEFVPFSLRLIKHHINQNHHEHGDQFTEKHHIGYLQR